MNQTLLKQELQKDVYQGLSDADALALLPVPTEALGNIQGDSKLQLLTMVLKDDLIDELQTKINDAIASGEESQLPIIKLAKALKNALQPTLLMSETYRINLGDEDVTAMFQAAKSAGLLSIDQSAKVEELATYTKFAEFDGVQLADVAAARFEPQEVEASYVTGDYIITTSNQGLDIEVTADKDCNVTIYLSVCNDSDLQNVESNFVRYQKPVGFEQVKDGKGIVSLSSRKVRQYNKVFAIADNDAVISVTVKTNRG